MSDQKPQTEAPEEESSGWLGLEAKAGLTLICLLAAAFSYMVWQKWQEMGSDQLAGTKKPAEVRERGDSDKGKPAPQDVREKPELELVKQESDIFSENPEPGIATLSSDDRKNSSPPPASNPFTTDNEPSVKDDLFANLEPEQPTRTPANIPTLDVPEETASNSAGDTPDDFSPFGDEPAPAVETPADKAESATTAETTPSDDFSPFGSELESTEPETTTPGESNRARELSETEDPFSDQPELKPLEEAPDPFPNAPDPFAERGPQPEPPETETETPAPEFTESLLDPEEKPEPVKTADADPVGELESKPNPFAAAPAEKHPLATESDDPVKVSPGDSFQDPLPLLEPVPEGKPKPAEEDPFGEFESVPAGAAQASSVTQVSPDPSRSRRSGTLAELDGPASTNLPANRNSSPFAENPFASPPPQPVAGEFKLNPDGTYEVRRGDSYWIISRKAYGSSRYYRALAEYNRKVIADPQQMKAGKKIAIPPVQELERKLSHLISETPAAPSPSIVMASAEREAGYFTDEQGNPMYRVQEDDTLTEISQRHLGRSSRWIQIYELNRDKLSNPNQLKIGTTLKLPADASRVRIVRGQ